MKTLLTVAPILGVTLLLSSCDPQTCGTDFIENHTAQTLYLLQADSVTIDTLPAGKIKTFQMVCGLGIGSSPSYGSNYLSIHNADTVCKREIWIEDNWNFMKIEKHKWEYHFTITDADFEY